MSQTIRWTAAKDGIAHAIIGRNPRTVCERVAVDERDAWPAERRCRVCELRTGTLA